MGLVIGQGGSPMYSVQGQGSISEVAFTPKALFLRMIPRSTNNSQAVITLGGLTITLNQTAATIVITEDYDTSDATYTFSSVGMAVGTEYDLAFVQNTLTPTWTMYKRVRSSTGTGFSSVGVDPAISVGVTAPTTQSGTLYWGHTSAAASTNGIFDMRDAAFCTHAGPGTSMDADLELFGKGAAPFQFGYVSILSAPADIFGAVWDRRDLNAAALTVNGTTSVAAVSYADGPLADIDSASLPSAVSTSLTWRAKIATNSIIRKSTGRLVELPDMTGGGGHLCQTTDANMPFVETIAGRFSITFPNQAVPAADYYLTARAGAGTSFTGNSAGFACVASMTAPGNTGSSGGRLLQLKESGAAGYWLPRWICGPGANNHRFGLNHNAQDIPTSQTPRVVCPGSHTPLIVTNNGNTVHQRVGDIQASTTQTASSLTRYVYQLGVPSASGGQDDACAFSLTGDLLAWGANKTASSDAVISFLASRSRCPPSVARKALIVIGSSTESGAQNDTASAATYPNLLTNTRQAKQIENYGSAGLAAGDELLTVSGGAGTFSAGEIVTQTTSNATGRFLGEGGGKMWLYDRAGTWDATNGITGGTSGATRNVSAQTNVATSSVCFGGSIMFGEYALCAAAHTGGVIFLWNTASNGIGANSNTGACEYDAFKNIVTEFKRILSVTAAGGAGTFTVGEVVTQTTSGATGVFIAEGGGIVYLRTPTGTFDGTNVLTGGSSGATRTASAVGTPGFNGAKHFVRPHQPRTGGTAAEHKAYRDLLRLGQGTDFDRLLDISLDQPFDDYLTSSDFGNTVFYNADQVHLNAVGHARLATDLDGGLSPASGGGFRGSFSGGFSRDLRSRSLVR